MLALALTVWLFLRLIFGLHCSSVSSSLCVICQGRCSPALSHLHFYGGTTHCSVSLNGAGADVFVRRSCLSFAGFCIVLSLIAAVPADFAASAVGQCLLGSCLRTLDVRHSGCSTIGLVRCIAVQLGTGTGAALPLRFAGALATKSVVPRFYLLTSLATDCATGSAASQLS